MEFEITLKVWVDYTSPLRVKQICMVSLAVDPGSGASARQALSQVWPVFSVQGMLKNHSIGWGIECHENIPCACSNQHCSW